MKVEKLFQVSLPARNISESVTFYQDILRCRLIAAFDKPVSMAFFDLGGTRLMLEESSDTVTSSVIYVKTSDLEKQASELATRGVKVRQQPHLIHHDADGTFGTAGESEYMAFIEDPTGNVIGLVERR